MHFRFRTPLGAQRAAEKVAAEFKRIRTVTAESASDPNCPVFIKRTLPAAKWQAEQAIAVPFLEQLKKVFGPGRATKNERK
jgi:hypothetical protein